MGAMPSIQDFDDESFNPFEARGWGDCVEFWRTLLQAWETNGPVQRGSFRQLAGMPEDVNRSEGQEIFLVFGASLIRQVLNDSENFNKDLHKTGFRAAFGNSLTQMDPPEHSFYRRIFQKAFMPGVIAQWSQSLVEPVIDELIGKIRRLDRVEIVEAFTFPYPFEIIYRQLRLPEGHTRTFHKLAVTEALFQTDLEKSAEAGRKLGAYFQALLEERRRAPGEDLVSRLAQVEADGERLPDDAIVSFLRQLINAAGDTTYRSTSSMLVCLLRDRPDQYRLLAKDPSLIPAAVEETLRLYAPVNSASRTVVRDVELAGVKAPAGAVVETAIGLVGRDPDVHENPHTFDLTRPQPERHMGFSNGPHICLGQHLARLEMTRALSALVKHFPDLRLDEDYPPPQIYGIAMLAPNDIHVRLH
jgi:cytochrome P450